MFALQTEMIVRSAFLQGQESVRAVRRISKKLNQAMGDHWHKEMLPRHFARDAATKYGYKERSKSYLKRKARKMGRDPAQFEQMRQFPLVFEGDLQRSLKAFEVKAFPGRFSIKMKGPSYVGMRPFRRNAPNMGKELTTVTDEEIREMTDFAIKVLPKIMATESKRVRKHTVFGA